MTIVSCPDPAAKAEQKQAHVSYYACALVGQVLLAYDSYFPVSVLVPVSVSVPVPVPAGFSKIHLPEITDPFTVLEQKLALSLEGK